MYKSLDPVSELYYESIRYRQGQQPTPEAISSYASYKDGYPVYTQWTDSRQSAIRARWRMSCNPRSCC